MLQEACVSRSFLCRFKAAIYLNCISKINLVKIYLLKIAVDNIKNFFQIYFCASRRLLLKIYFMDNKHVFVSYDANIFTEGIFDANIFMKKIFCFQKIVAENIIIVS